MKFIFLVLVLAAVGCASSAPKEAPASAPSAEVLTPVEGDEASQVLSKKKCPRKSKLINGQCVMQVESDE